MTLILVLLSLPNSRLVMAASYDTLLPENTADALHCTSKTDLQLVSLLSPHLPDRGPCDKRDVLNDYLRP
jgi:hypothetical protein